jgi:hypothetical protein
MVLLVLKGSDLCELSIEAIRSGNILVAKHSRQNIAEALQSLEFRS